MGGLTQDICIGVRVKLGPAQDPAHVEMQFGQCMLVLGPGFWSPIEIQEAGPGFRSPSEIQELGLGTRVCST